MRCRANGRAMSGVNQSNWFIVPLQPESSRRTRRTPGPPRRFSVDRFCEGPAEGMRRIDAQDLHFLGVERKLLECEDQVALFGMALDIGIELRGEEIAFDHVAFELGHI